MSSELPRDEIVYFLDRNFGTKVIASRLRDAGFKVEIHDDHLVQTAPDEEWIAFVANKHWVALTKDKNIRYRAAEISSVREANARLLVIRAKNTTGKDIADILIQNRSKIETFIKRTEAPFVAGVDRNGKLIAYEI